ncbi:MAG TPA: carbonic anhydrase [Acidimicrobiales bacterium]
MGAIDELLARHRAGLAQRTCCDLDSGHHAKPRLRVVVLTCMDARIDPAKLLGLRPGDAHVLRNAGGLVTDDALRSLVLSQQALGTEEVMVIQHTSCGVHGLRDADLSGRLTAQTGIDLGLTFGGFDDVDASVRTSLAKVRDCVWLNRRDAARGFVYDVATGHLREVT